MLKFISPLVLTLLLAAPAVAGDCSSQAADKKLSGAAKASFLKKCVTTDCRAQAGDKKLSGAAKTSFTTKCLADGLAGYCAEQATNKKLAGAAKNSFMTKCQSGK